MINYGSYNPTLNSIEAYLVKAGYTGDLIANVKTLAFSFIKARTSEFELRRGLYDLFEHEKPNGGLAKDVEYVFDQANKYDDSGNRIKKSLDWFKK